MGYLKILSQVCVCMVFSLFQVCSLKKCSDQDINIEISSDSSATRAIGASHLTEAEYLNPDGLESLIWYYGTINTTHQIGDVVVGGIFTVSNGSYDEIVFSATQSNNTVVVMEAYFETLSEEDNGVKIIIQRNKDSIVCEESFVLTTEYCPQLLPKENHTDIVNGINSTYLTDAIYTCKGDVGVIVVDGIYTNNSMSYEQSCRSNATWNGTEEVFCSYAPNPDLQIFPPVKETFDRNTYVVNDTLSFNCTGAMGYPTANRTTIMIKRPDADFEELKGSLKLTSYENSLVVKCRAMNEYVDYIDNNKGYSPTETLNVLFPPYNDSVSDVFTQQVQIGFKSTIEFIFSLNPLTTQNYVFLKKNGIAQNESSARLQNLTNTSQAYLLFFENVTEENLGNYTLRVQSSLPYFNESTLYMTIVLTEESFDAGNSGKSTMSIIYIVIGVVGGIVLILLFLLLFLYCRRQKRDVSSSVNRASEAVSTEQAQKEERINPIYGSSTMNEKEERVNPLYGTSSDCGDATYSSVVKPKKKNKKGKSEKEEKINPLYNPSTANDNTVEEAYAAVDKRKKKGGNENPVFTVDISGDTYTEVNKKKKKPVPAPTEPDVMYAEVRKKNKKKKSDTDDNLHGS